MKNRATRKSNMRRFRSRGRGSENVLKALGVELELERVWYCGRWIPSSRLGEVLEVLEFLLVWDFGGYIVNMMYVCKEFQTVSTVVQRVTHNQYMNLEKIAIAMHSSWNLGGW